MALCEFERMSPEERKECGRRGGIKSGETKRRKKAMKEALGVLLTMPIKDGKLFDTESVENFNDIKGKNISVQDALLVSMIAKALKGDVRSAEWVRDTAGQKPVQQVEVSAIDNDALNEVEDMVKAAYEKGNN